MKNFFAALFTALLMVCTLSAHANDPQAADVYDSQPLPNAPYQEPSFIDYVSYAFSVDDDLDAHLRSFTVRVVARTNGKGLGSQGTGIIIAPGIILTNAHVVQHKEHGVRDHVMVRYGYRTYDAEIIGISPNRDVAVLRTDEFGDVAPISERRVRDGDKFAAIGHPDADLSGEVSQGEYLGRAYGYDVVKGYDYNGPVRYIVSSVKSRPGYSGGPTINATTGKVVGLTVGLITGYRNSDGRRIRRDKPVFAIAIPIDIAMEEAERIMSGYYEKPEAVTAA